MVQHHQILRSVLPHLLLLSSNNLKIVASQKSDYDFDLPLALEHSLNYGSASTELDGYADQETVEKVLLE